MRPPDLPGGNEELRPCGAAGSRAASMRPPDLPGGNSVADAAQRYWYAGFNEAAGFTRRKLQQHRHRHCQLMRWASMRPPDLPGGNPPHVLEYMATVGASFNEAAGFTRRKPRLPPPSSLVHLRFNEAAGFTRRKRVPRVWTTPALPRCFNEAAGFTRRKQRINTQESPLPSRRFNEAAGFTRRKLFGLRYITSRAT